MAVITITLFVTSSLRTFGSGYETTNNSAGVDNIAQGYTYAYMVHKYISSIFGTCTVYPLRVHCMFNWIYKKEQKPKKT